jgi:hypothetical protein
MDGGLFMSVNRLMVIVPVLAGLVVTGTAVARMMPAESVRDSVYQTCAHNGVHFNKQGHANCGLHKGWQSAPTSAPDQPVTITGTAATPTTGLGNGLLVHTQPSHLAKPVHTAGTHSGQGHGAKSHGKSSRNKHG